MTAGTPEALVEASYVLLKRGLFERPGHHGYTGVLRHAGRFSHEEASAYAVHGGSVTMMLASEAPDYSPACWHETQVEDLLDLLRIEREAKATATAEAASLRAGVEAKDRRIAELEAALEPFAWFGEVATPDTAITWSGVRHTERISTRFRHEHFRAARTALARAATAGEGHSDELERLRKDNKDMRTELDALIQEVLKNG